MPLEESIHSLAARLPDVLSLIETEEGTKNALVLPFIAALGYNPFDPNEVIPEYVADVGIRRGERVDFALMRDREPIILFECKAANVNLGDSHISQLFRYFTTTPVRIGVLTNGVVYRFFSDLDKANTMDQQPFLEVNLAELDDATVAVLHRFAKGSFDAERTIEAALDLKYTNSIQQVLAEEFANPSGELVRMIARRVHGSSVPQAVIKRFEALVKDAFARFINKRTEARPQSGPEPDGSGTSTEEAIAQHRPNPAPVELPIDLFMEPGVGMYSRARLEDDGFTVVVLAGSAICAHERRTAGLVVSEQRRDALERATWVEDGEHYQLTQDYRCTSPTNAATFVLGWHANGRQWWTDADGRKLAQILNG